MRTPPSLRFAATKIQPPRRRATRVERPALDAALRDAIRSRRVVLVQAPAGFGKTSLLATLFAPDAGLAAAWVSLDEDDDAERLLACLVAALEPHDLPWRASPDALVELAGADAAGLRKAAAGLVNALAGADAGHGVIVLDDLHRVESASAFALLDVLIERAPPHWTLLLATRSVPPPAVAALARARANAELAEFTQEQLRFTPAEAAALLQAEGLPQADAGTLFDRTAGWPAGLRLALAALKTRGAVDHRLLDRHLFDYVAAEVLDDMPQPLHDFLLRVAVLPELTANRAAAVSGDPRAAERLDEIERRGLFVTALDAHDRTLVLHDLLRDALLQRQAERLPGERAALLRRAAAGEADTLRRVGYLLRAEDWQAAEAALMHDAAELFLHGGAGEVLRLAEQFPPAQRSARLCGLGASASALRWAWDDMARWLEQGVQAARAAGEPLALQVAQARLAYALYPLDRNAEAESLITALHAQALAPPARAWLLLADCMQHFRRNPHARLPALFGELLQILEAGQPLFLWWEMAPPFSWSTIAGMPALMQRYVDGVLPKIGERALPLRAELRLLQAVLHLWAGRIADAEAQLAAAGDDIAWLAVSGETQVGVRIVRATVDAMHGRGDAVQHSLDALLRLEDDAAPERRELWRHQMAVYGVRLADAVGDVVALRRWCSLLRENPLVSDTVQNSRAIAARARFAAAQGRWADAVVQFELLADVLPGMDVMGQRTDLTLRWAHALVRLDRLTEAARLVAPVLARLRADGGHGQPLLCGPALLQALADARWGVLLDAEQKADLAAAARFATAVRGSMAVDQPAAAAATDDQGLSQREREVLERIAAGDSNKVIARDLDISPHTVKRHVANILDKLGLGSRGQAAAWLRAHSAG